VGIKGSLALSALDALPSHIAVLDEDGTIIAVNRTWRQFAKANSARSNVHENANYLQVCDNVQGQEAEEAHAFADGIRSVLRGEREQFALEYPCHSPTEQRWFVGRVSCFVHEDELYALVAHDNVTEAKLVEMNLRKKSEIIDTVNEAGHLLAAELDQQRLLQAITDAATKLAGAEFGSFFYNVVNEDGEIYSLYTLSGVPIDSFAQFPMPRNTAVFGPTFRGEGIVRSDDITLDPRYGQNSPHQGMPEGHLPVRSYLAVPVVSRQGEVLGGLFFGHSTPGMFTDYEEGLIVGLAAQAAIALENAYLYADVFEERERFRTTLLSIGDGVIATDRLGKITLMNPVAERLTGWSQSEAMGRPVSDIFHIINEQTRQPVENPIEKVLQYGIVVGLANHTVLITRDGVETPISDSGAPIPDSSGKVAGMVLVFRDVSEEKRAEAERARLAAIVDSSDDAIISKTLQGIVTSWNKGAQRIFGYTADEVVGKPITMLFPLDRLHEEVDILAKLSRGEHIDHYETIRVRKSGEHFPISVTVSPIRDSSGHIIGASKIAQDITERKKAEMHERQLVAINERQRLARDLHDAVSQVLFSANVLAESIPRLRERNPDKAYEQLGELRQLTQGASAEMRTLLFELRPENLVNTQLEELINQLGKALQARRRIHAEVIVEKKHYHRLPEDVHVAFYRIAQESINNLARHSNATHARARLSYKPDELQLIVVDNGDGFNINHQSSGFGLNSMRERAAGIGATLDIKSKKGIGTRVSLVWRG
jgi:PAS domain S-box-containing protein